MARSRICSIPDCGKPHYGRGFCGSHWTRWKRYGDPLAGATSKGQAAAFYRDTVLTFDGDGCLLWPYAKSTGYGALTVDGKMRLVHRLVCDEIHGAAPTPKHEVAHLCGNGHLACVNPKHLAWKTHVENEADELIHGTQTRGERCGTSKLTEADVIEIRALRGLPLKELASRYGVSRDAISSIQLRKKWAWLKEPVPGVP